MDLTVDSVELHGVQQDGFETCILHCLLHSIESAKLYIYMNILLYFGD